MREFKKHRTMGAELLRISLGAVGVLALALVAFVCIRAAWGMYGKFTEAAAARSGAQTELEELRARHTAIGTSVKELSSDRGVEAQIRERYGLSLPGEGQISIVRQATSSDLLKEQQGFWVKLWDALFVW